VKYVIRTMLSSSMLSAPAQMPAIAIVTSWHELAGTDGSQLVDRPNEFRGSFVY
jgi:hypothetical protein